MAARAGAEKKKRDAARQRAQASDESAGKIPRELREKLKKAKAAKGLLRDLEEQVRLFVKNWEDQTKKEEKLELDSEDEEIVFVGRNGQMHDMPLSPKSKNSIDKDDIERDRLVFDSLANDQGASFGYVQWCSSLCMVLVLTLVQSLARPFHSFLLRSTHLVNYCRQSSTTGGIRRHPANKRQWQVCDACAASSSVGHGLSTDGPVLYLCYIHFLLQGPFALPHSSKTSL